MPFKKNDPAVYFEAVFDKTHSTTGLNPLGHKKVDRWRGIYIMNYGSFKIKRQYNQKLNTHSWWVIDKRGNKQITDHLITSQLDEMFPRVALNDTGFLKVTGPRMDFRA
jgi:hypothetical protein